MVRTYLHGSRPGFTPRPFDQEQLTSTKASFQSPTPSFEADDEYSLESSIATQDMSPRRTEWIYRGPPRYPGEDTRLTSNKELYGWYSYGWAAEVFVICGIGSFLPITLEQLARERGVLLGDKSKPCSASFHITQSATPGSDSVLFSTRTVSTLSTDAGPCVIRLLGIEINTASFALYTFSLSVLVQAILIISMSGAADHGKYRKSLLLSFAFTGAIATMLFLAIVPRVYVLGALLAVISNSCFGASFVLLNSFLPLLVRHHPSVQSTASDSRHQSEEGTHNEEPFYHEDDGLDNSTQALLGSSQAARKPQYPLVIATGHQGASSMGSHMLRSATGQLGKAFASPELQLSTKISSYGIGIGYIAGVVVQILAIGIIILTSSISDSSNLAFRIVLFFIGLWWILFTIPAALWLRPRPGPSIPLTAEGKRGRSWLGYIGYAWRSLGKTILCAGKLRDVLLFLGSWFMISDSIATVSGTAILFAKTELKMKPTSLALINVIATLSGVLGAFTWSKISRWFNARPSQTIVACICLFEVIPIYGLLGYIPAIKRWGVFGLQQPWEMYPLGAVYGFVLGGLSSYCRSLFGELIPPGSEAAFYALYAITDKGSSIFGPAAVGAITDRYGEIRPAFVFLAVLIFIPLPLMMLVDVDRGKRDGARMARALEGKKHSDPRDVSEDSTTEPLDEEVDD